MSKPFLNPDHNGIIHDIQYNFFGNRLATAGSDGKINIFSISSNETIQKQAELSNHEDSIWKVSWSHPRFGNILASCGFDKKVLIWKEVSNEKWEVIFQYSDHCHSVNTVQFSPHEYGLMLLCGSSDGSISLHEYKDKENVWFSYKKEKAHEGGVTCVSWGPAFNSISFSKEDMNHSLSKMKFISGGCDNKVKCWEIDENKEEFICKTVNDHKSWVRDVAWLHYLGLNQQVAASCGEDGMVFIYTTTQKGDWTIVFEKNFNNLPVWNVSWSNCGTNLAVSGSDNKIYLLKQSLDNKWEIGSRVDEQGQFIEDK